MSDSFSTLTSADILLVIEAGICLLIFIAIGVCGYRECKRGDEEISSYQPSEENSPP